MGGGCCLVGQMEGLGIELRGKGDRFLARQGQRPECHAVAHHDILEIENVVHIIRLLEAISRQMAHLPARKSRHHSSTDKEVGELSVYVNCQLMLSPGAPRGTVMVARVRIWPPGADT